MTREEILAHLNVGESRSVEVDCRCVSEGLSLVRTVEIVAPSAVRVSFEAWGYDEGGAYFQGEFSSIDSAVASVEKFLQQPLLAWSNHTASGYYPPRPCNEGRGEDLENLLSSGDLELPDGTTFAVSPEQWNSIWKRRET